MKMTPVLLLLWSGIHLTFISARLQHFILHNNSVIWNTALSTCQGKDMSPVTLYDKVDENLLSKLEPVWLGLHKNRSITWSDGTPFNFSQSVVTVTDEQICEAIHNNTWKGYNCTDRKPFMCYKGDNYTLIEEPELNWCQARQYCKSQFSDLVSISDKTQNQKVIEKGNNTSFWIGLMHDNWEWQDKSCSFYRPLEFKPKFNCTVYTYIQNFTTYECINEAHPLCSKGTVKIKLIQENKTWEDAFDYCKANHSRLLWIQDDDDQEAVKQWLQHTYDVAGPLWIGLRQSRVFGFWIWTSDRPVTNNNNRWKDKKAPEMPLSYQCGVINTDDYTWSDEDCRIHHYFLCEEDIIFLK